MISNLKILCLISIFLLLLLPETVFATPNDSSYISAVYVDGTQSFVKITNASHRPIGFSRHKLYIRNGTSLKLIEINASFTLLQKQSLVLANFNEGFCQSVGESVCNAIWKFNTSDLGSIKAGSTIYLANHLGMLDSLSVTQQDFSAFKAGFALGRYEYICNKPVCKGYAPFETTLTSTPDLSAELPATSEKEYFQMSQHTFTMQEGDGYDGIAFKFKTDEAADYQLRLLTKSGSLIYESKGNLSANESADILWQGEGKAHLISPDGIVLVWARFQKKESKKEFLFKDTLFYRAY